MFTNYSPHIRPQQFVHDELYCLVKRSVLNMRGGGTWPAARFSLNVWARWISLKKGSKHSSKNIGCYFCGSCVRASQLLTKANIDRVSESSTAWLTFFRVAVPTLVSLFFFFLHDFGGNVARSIFIMNDCDPQHRLNKRRLRIWHRHGFNKKYNFLQNVRYLPV